MEGWIKLHRRLQDHWLWQEKRKFSKVEAWLDLLLRANHKENKILIGRNLVDVKSGQFITSTLKLAQAWGWGKTTVKQFLNLLESEKMITQNANAKYTLVTIENWGKYQGEEIKMRTLTERRENADGTLADTNKNEKNINYIITTTTETGAEENRKEISEASADLIQKENLNQLGVDPSGLGTKYTHLDVDSRELNRKLGHSDVSSEGLNLNHSSVDLGGLKEKSGAIPDDLDKNDDFLSCLENHYRKRVFRGFSANDFITAIALYEASYPLEFILECIDKKCDEVAGKRKINSLNFFTGFIEDEWNKLQIKNKAKVIEINKRKSEVNKNEFGSGAEKKGGSPFEGYKLPEPKISDELAKLEGEELNEWMRKNGIY